MTQTFSELLQDVYDALGHQLTKGVVATGGSTTTIIDTTLSADYQDDHFLNYQAFVHRDAGGAGAAPQNEVQRVTAYTASTRTMTTGAFTTAVAVGDEILLARPSPFLLADMKRYCNTAIRMLGRIRQFDTSLTTASNQTEYTLPDAIRVKPNRVWIQTLTTDADDNKYIPIQDFRVEEGAEGADWTLIIPQFSSGKKIKIEYYDTHYIMSAYNDPVSESVPAPLAVAVCAWYIASKQASVDATWAQTAQELFSVYETQLARNPIYTKASKRIGFPQWSRGIVDKVPDPIT